MARDALDYLQELATSDPEYRGAAAAYDLAQKVAHSIRAMRRRANLKQQELGERLHLSQGRISQIESGLVDYAPSLDLVAKIAEACGETVDLQFSGEAHETPESSRLKYEVFATRAARRKRSRTTAEPDVTETE